MTLTAHAAVGAVIAAKIGNPALAIPIALASHAVLDMVPHWDAATNRKDKSRRRLFIDSSADVLTAIFVSYSILALLFPNANLIYAALIVFFAVLPDVLMAPYLFFKVMFFKWAYDFGKLTNNELDKPGGIITQLIIVLAVIFLGKVF